LPVGDYQIRKIKFVMLSPERLLMFLFDVVGYPKELNLRNQVPLFSHSHSSVLLLVERFEHCMRTTDPNNLPQVALVIVTLAKK